MSYPPEHKPRVHARIVEVAARLFREEGMHATGIDRLMAEAGLTRGGFYAHFPSKAALFAEVLQATFQESRENLVGRGNERLTGKAWLRAATRRYLDPKHRDQPELGCAIPSLGAEVARAPAAGRETVGAEVASIIKAFSERGLLPESEATALLATWVGAMTMARAVADPAQSKAIVEACRNHPRRSSRSRSRPPPRPRPARRGRAPESVDASLRPPSSGFFLRLALFARASVKPGRPARTC
ncbi:MAG: TetR/AcrR family transcriptional regulator [Myxococcota bacterium]